MVEGSEPGFFVALSGAARDSAGGRRLAAWIGAEWVERPLPTDRPGLVVTPEGLRLHVPGVKPMHWHPGLTWRRVRNAGVDTLVAALDLRPGERVLDGTLGLGHDARMLARAGARVLALEARPALIAFTLDGLCRWDRAAAARIGVRCADHRTWLAEAAPASVDHVYLDPMFPPGREGASTNLAPLRSLPRLPRVSPETLRAGWRVCRRRLLLKLAPFEPCPVVGGLPPARLAGSRRVQYALWSREPLG